MFTDQKPGYRIQHSLALLLAIGATFALGRSSGTAALIYVGDIQTVAVPSHVSGAPWLYPGQAQRIEATAGQYRFYLENSYWNFGAFGPHNEVVGGVIIVTEDLVPVMDCPLAYGTDPNATTRTIFFNLASDQTLLAGVADDALWDNAGSAVFTLTKIGPPVPEPTSAAITAVMAGIGFGYRRCRRSNSQWRGVSHF